jgi:hypothetical protein
MPRSRRTRAKRRRRPRDEPRRRLARPADAEARLLALAREVAALPADATLGDVMRLLTRAHAPDAPLPRVVGQAWVRSRDDKTAALALAWAREQVRLAVEERLLRTPARVAIAADPATRAWLLLAAAESIAREAPEAAADRLRTLFELTGQVPPPTT